MKFLLKFIGVLIVLIFLPIGIIVGFTMGGLAAGVKIATATLNSVRPKGANDDKFSGRV